MVFTFERKLCCKQLKLHIFFSFLFYKEVTGPHLLEEVVMVAMLPRALLFSLIYLFDCVGLSCGIRASLVTALRLSCPMACEILVPWTGIEPLPPALEGGFLTTTTTTTKSLQSCPTLCDPTHGSPPGSHVPGILQARTLEWVAISFSNAWKCKVKVQSLSRVRLLATPWTVAYQAPLSWDFPGKSTGVGCHCLLH